MRKIILLLVGVVGLAGCGSGPDQPQQMPMPINQQPTNPGTPGGFPGFPAPGQTPGFPQQGSNNWPVEAQETCSMIQSLLTWNVLDSGVDQIDDTLSQAALSNADTTTTVVCASFSALCPAPMVSANRECEEVLPRIRFVMGHRCDFLREALAQNQSNLYLFTTQARLTRNREFMQEYSKLSTINYNNVTGLCSLMKRESCGNLPSYCSEYR